MSKYERFDDSGVDFNEPVTDVRDTAEIHTESEQHINTDLASEEHHGYAHNGHDTTNAIAPGSPTRKPGNGSVVNGNSFDEIRVDVALEDDSENKGEVLERAKDFFLEYNDNYTVSWDEAAQALSEAEDPSNPPVPGANWPYIRWRLRRFVESFAFRVFTFFLIIFDICIVIADLVDNPDPGGKMSTLQVIDLIITVWFVIELVLRIVALSHPLFFSQWYNVVDFAVVLITFIIVCVAASATGEWAEKLAILTVLRFVRVARLIRLFTEKKQLETAARQMISQNKRRYQQDGYDLDLTYVTKRIIATSFPSTGMLALFRNPIEKVAAFLNNKHPGKFRMYNLCSERTYETHHFDGCKVERFMIDDHNVPTLEDMVRFADSVRKWLSQDPENVIVVHCKGGKGRTGTMICVWLVEAGIFTSATESLDYFGNRRTDLNVSKKFQGVETPSQSRYVGYYELIHHNGGQLPGSRPLSIKEITIHGMMYVGEGNGNDFWLNVDQGRGNQVFSAHIGYRRNCQAVYDAASDKLTIQLINCPSLDGDIRVLFQTHSKSVPKGYEKAPFYFWFNSAFVQQKMVLHRHDLDNPHKPKTWHCFRESFRLEVTFQDASSASSV